MKHRSEDAPWGKHYFPSDCGVPGPSLSSWSLMIACQLSNFSQNSCVVMTRNCRAENAELVRVLPGENIPPEIDVLVTLSAITTTQITVSLGERVQKARATNGIVTVIISGLLNACTFHRMPLKSNLMAHGPKWALLLSGGLWKINQRLYSMKGEVLNHQVGHFLWSRREILERVEVSLDAVRENYRQQATERVQLCDERMIDGFCDCGLHKKCYRKLESLICELRFGSTFP